MYWIILFTYIKLRVGIVHTLCQQAVLRYSYYLNERSFTCDGQSESTLSKISWRHTVVNRLRLWITRSEANRVARNWRLMPDVWIAVKNYPQKRFGPMGSMNWHQGSKIWWPVYDGQYAIGLSKYIDIMLPSSLLS